jgi:hypothetical protein
MLDPEGVTHSENTANPEIPDFSGLEVDPGSYSTVTLSVHRERRINSGTIPTIPGGEFQVELAPMKDGPKISVEGASVTYELVLQTVDGLVRLPRGGLRTFDSNEMSGLENIVRGQQLVAVVKRGGEEKAYAANVISEAGTITLNRRLGPDDKDTYTLQVAELVHGLKDIKSF